MATYRPDPAAEWLAAVRGGVVLMAPASASAELAALWPELTAADPTSAVLDRLTAGGLSATPSFALVVRDPVNDTMRVVVRGELLVRAGGTEISGAEVATWAERVIAGDDLEVVVSGADPRGVDLPLVEGMVPVSSVRSHAVEPVAIPVATPTPTPAPTPTPTLTPMPMSTRLPATSLPLPPVAATEQTMVPAEDTVAGAPARVTSPEPFDGDHDGLTVASIDLQRLRAERAARAVETPAVGLPIAGTAPSSPVTTLRMPDGALEALGHEVVLGRAPSVSQVSGVRLPRLLTIGAGDPDISRNHVRITVEGDTVVVTDLYSRNGTHVVAPGKPPVKLRAGEPTPVLAGTVVDLGGGWTVQVVAD